MNPVCPPPADAQEPGFLRALDRDRMLDLVRRHLGAGATVLALHPDYVRWKERDGSLVGWRADITHDGEPTTGYVTARTAAHARLSDEAERIAHRADDDHDGLHAFALVPDEDLLLLSFPLDRALPDLRRVVRASKLRGLLADHCPELVPAGLRFSKSRSRRELVRYKPERRAVLRWDIACVDAQAEVAAQRTVWIRVHAEPMAERVRMALAAAAAAGVRCPRLLAAPHERLLIESHVDGQPWADDTDAATRAAATALAALHATGSPTRLSVHGPLQQLDLVLRATEDLGRLRPQLGRVAAAIADDLAHRVPPAGNHTFLHGDCHRGQVLLGADAGLCDFDRACTGPAAFDLATFHAHELVRDPVAGAAASAAFLAAYGAQAPLPATGELAWWQAGELLRAAMTPFRRLAADWPTASMRLLELAAVAAQRTRP